MITQRIDFHIKRCIISVGIYPQIRITKVYRKTIIKNAFISFFLLLTFIITLKFLDTIRTTTNSSNIPYVNLSLSPVRKANGEVETYYTDILINSNKNLVSGSQIELNYDPESIKNPTISQGEFLKIKVKNEIITNGLIKATYIIPYKTSGAVGSGKLATISFEIVKDGSQINFTNNTIVTVLGSNVNTAKYSEGITINELADTPSDTPSETSNQIDDINTPWYIELMNKIKQFFIGIFSRLF